jgi:hypothetical protein
MVCTVCSEKALAGTAIADTTLDPWVELSIVEAALDDTAFHSYYFLTYRELTDTVTVYDSAVTFVIRVPYGYSTEKYFFGGGLDHGGAVLQDQQLRLTIDFNDSIFTLLPPVELSALFRLDPKGPDFFGPQVDSLVLTQTGASRKLSFKFNPLSAFEQYDITYDTAHYLISKIECQVRNLPFGDDPPPVIPREKITYLFAQRNYFENHIDAVSDFVIYQNGQWVTNWSYAGYNIINYLNQ